MAINHEELVKDVACLSALIPGANSYLNIEGQALVNAL